jgi:hypothetical protein
MHLQSKTSGNIITIIMQPGGAAPMLEKIDLALSEGIRAIVVPMAAIKTFRMDDVEGLVEGKLRAEREGAYLVMSDVADKMYQAFRALGLEDFFVIFRNEKAAFNHARNLLAEEQASGKRRAPDKKIDGKYIEETLQKVRQKAGMIKARSVKLTLPEMTLKVFTKKCIKDIFYLDLLAWLTDKDSDVLSGKGISENFGLHEGDLKKAFEDLADAGVLEKTTSGFFGKPTYTIIQNDEWKKCVAELVRLMRTPGGKAKILGWMKE